jgi:hypothetical protein
MVRERAAARLGTLSDAYDGGHSPFGGYLTLMGTFAAAATAGLASGRIRKRSERLSVRDLVLLAAGTQALARIVSKDRVTSPLRAPFTRYVKDGPPGEVVEEARGNGVRLAVGDLVTCPYCTGQWIALALVVGLLHRPRETRLVASIAAISRAADVLQAAYVRIAPDD